MMTWPESGQAVTCKRIRNAASSVNLKSPLDSLSKLKLPGLLMLFQSSSPPPGTQLSWRRGGGGLSLEVM